MEEGAVGPAAETNNGNKRQRKAPETFKAGPASGKLRGDEVEVCKPPCSLYQLYPLYPSVTLATITLWHPRWPTPRERSERRPLQTKPLLLKRRRKQL